MTGLHGMATSAERWLDRGDGAPARGRVVLGVAGCYLLFIATWVPLNQWSVGRDAAVLFLPGERASPFVPEAEYVYALGYVLPIVACFRVPTARGLARAFVAFLATLVVAYTTYAVFPVYLERPPLTVDSPATFLLSIEYRDPSYNHFPSLHAALVWLGYLAARTGLRRPGLYAAAAVGVTAATLFVKQHYLVDLAYGILLAFAAWKMAGHWLGGVSRHDGGSLREAP